MGDLLSLTAPVFGPNGILFGTTTYGGISNAGTVFALYGTAALSTGFSLFQLQRTARGTWTPTVLYTFPPNGTLLSSPLILRGGNLYGTTATITGLGGQGPGGDVFALQKPAAAGEPWKEILLHHFQRRDSPHGSIVFDANGVIYGTTSSSNAAPNAGYAYQVTVPRPADSRMQRNP